MQSESKKYFIAEIREEMTIYNIKDIDKRSVDDFFEAVKDISSCKQEKRIFDMTTSNGMLLEKYLNIIKTSSARTNVNDLDSMLRTANKYLFDYCATISTYVDMVEKILTKKSSEKLDAFRKDCSKQYDDKLGYRFFCRLRQFIVHYDFPLNHISDSLDVGKRITCSKEGLLKFSKWNTVKDDIEKMDDYIDVTPMIMQANVSITILHLQFMYYYAEYIQEMANAVMKFTEQYGVSKPVILIANNKEDIYSGQFTMKPICEVLNDLQILVKECLENPIIGMEEAPTN